MADRPVPGYLTKPPHARILHRGVGVEAAGDGVGDKTAALLGEDRQQPLLSGDHLVDFGRLPVEVVSNSLLPRARWKHQLKRLQIIRGKLHERGAPAKSLQ